MNASRDLAFLDRPEILSVLFHPRPEPSHARTPAQAEDLMVPVARDVSVAVRFHWTAAPGSAPGILLFHGNGEIASDYDDLGPVYAKMGVQFIVAEYRGYGRSQGNPSVSTMMTDCHRIFDAVTEWRGARGHTGPLVVMGRSLGSASALELASTRASDVAGLVIESGFAHAGPLLTLLGVRTDAGAFPEDGTFDQLAKIGAFGGPTLVIHAQFDHIIPFSDGKALCEAAADPEKRLVTIPGANHNDIFFRGMETYLDAVAWLVARC